MPEFFRSPDRHEALWLQALRTDAQANQMRNSILPGIGGSILETIQNVMKSQQARTAGQGQLTTLLAEKGMLGMGTPGQPQTGTVARGGGRVWDQGVPIEQAYPDMRFGTETGMTVKKQKDKEILNEQEIALFSKHLKVKPDELKGVRPEMLKSMLSATGAAASLSEKKAKEEKKEEESLKELQVPGYQLGSDVRPTTKEASDLRFASGSLNDFSKGVDRMKNLIEQYGSTELTGTASGEMESLAANLKLTLKEVQKLGVLSASDIAFLEAQIFDPSSTKSIFTKKDTAIKQLETAKSRAQSLLTESLKARGYSASTKPAVRQNAKVENVPAIGLEGNDAKRLAELRAKAAKAAGVKK